MIEDYDQHEKDKLTQRVNELVEEQNHYERLKRVFSTDAGILTLEWLLELSGYWLASISNDKQMGRFELARTIFDQICLADFNIASLILSRRRDNRLNNLAKEKKQLEEKLK